MDVFDISTTCYDGAVDQLDSIKVVNKYFVWLLLLVALPSLQVTSLKCSPISHPSLGAGMGGLLGYMFGRGTGGGGYGGGYYRRTPHYGWNVPGGGGGGWGSAPRSSWSSGGSSSGGSHTTSGEYDTHTHGVCYQSLLVCISWNCSMQLLLYITHS